MMNNDMLANIEYLREKANVSYEEAEALLERHDGNVMRVLVELERQGRVYNQSAGDTYHSEQQAQSCDMNDAKERATSFINRAFATRLVVEKKQEDGDTNLLANIPVPFAIGVALAAPWLTVGAAALTFATGHNVKIKQEKTDEPEA